MGGGMEAQKNKFIEDWGSARENLEHNFRWTRRNFALVGIFGIAVPFLVYKGIVREFHMQDEDAENMPFRTAKGIQSLSTGELAIHLGTDPVGRAWYLICKESLMSSKNIQPFLWRLSYLLQNFMPPKMLLSSPWSERETMVKGVSNPTSSFISREDNNDSRILAD